MKSEPPPAPRNGVPAGVTGGGGGGMLPAVAFCALCIALKAARARAATSAMTDAWSPPPPPPPLLLLLGWAPAAPAGGGLAGGMGAGGMGGMLPPAAVGRG